MLPDRLAPMPPAPRDLLVRLRTGLLAVEALAVLVGGLLGVGLPVAALAALVVVGALGNVVLARLPVRWAAAGSGWVLCTDALRLTAMLAILGGASSPFSAAYLVLVIQASLLLSPRWTVATVLLVLAGYGSLFWLPVRPHSHHDMQGHLVGMFLTVALVGPLIALAIGWVRRTLSQAEVALSTVREQQAQAARLGALATLAGGAAHELASPLATINIVASEWARRAQEPLDQHDADLVLGEVSRCRAVLSELAADVGAGMGERRERIALGDLLALAVERLQDRDRVRVEADDETVEFEVVVPVSLLAHAVRGLLRNALQASRESVVLAPTVRDGALVVQVIDTGPGMDPQHLARAQEPFFTTKSVGEGLGLGLFVVGNVARQLGGRLELISSVADGTCATLVVPIEVGT